MRSESFAGWPGPVWEVIPADRGKPHARKGEFMLTGQLGDVMKESAQTGVSYIRSIADKYNIKPEFFQEHDLHIHIPEGAVPKDGPSAGITMATAMLSAVTGTPVKANLAMTGEITLRGRVLPIGGLKENFWQPRAQALRPYWSRRRTDRILKKWNKRSQTAF